MSTRSANLLAVLDTLIDDGVQYGRGNGLKRARDAAADLIGAAKAADLELERDGYPVGHWRRVDLRAALAQIVGDGAREVVCCDVVAPNGSVVASRVDIDYADELLRDYKYGDCHKANYLAAAPQGDAGTVREAALHETGDYQKAFFWVARILSRYGDRIGPSTHALIAERLAELSRTHPQATHKDSQA